MKREAPTKVGWKEICGAKKRNGTPCQLPPLQGRTRCRIHGGASQVGIECHGFKHGIYSKYVPKTLRNDFEAILKDRDLTELREELALLTLRSTELLTELEQTPPPWSEVEAKFKSLKDCEDESVKGALLDEIERLISEGASALKHQKAVWSELRGVIQDKTKTASAEWNRLSDLQGLVKLDTVMGLWRGNLEGIRSAVMNPAFHGLSPVEQLRTLSKAVMRFMPPPSQALECSVIDPVEPSASPGQ